MALFGRRNKELPSIIEEPLVRMAPSEEEPPAMHEPTEEEAIPEETAPLTESSNRVILGMNADLVNQVRQKVEALKNDKSKLEDDYKELTTRVINAEAKSVNVENQFNKFKDSLRNEFMTEARKEIKHEIKLHNETVSTTHSRISKIDDELLKLIKRQEDFEFVSSFQDYYQLIKLCIFMLTNVESNSPVINTLIQTIHSLVEDMNRNRLFATGKDAIITSLLNLKTYWRNKDSHVEELIGAEVNALENMR